MRTIEGTPVVAAPPQRCFELSGDMDLHARSAAGTAAGGRRWGHRDWRGVIQRARLRCGRLRVEADRSTESRGSLESHSMCYSAWLVTDIGDAAAVGGV